MSALSSEVIAANNMDVTLALSLAQRLPTRSSVPSGPIDNLSNGVALSHLP